VTVLKNDVGTMLPGDPEENTARVRAADGIPLSAADVEALAGLAETLSVPLPYLMAAPTKPAAAARL
jgi:LDH2 family malate/lactate/ureidoglycolate dehydrogenase